MSKTQNTPAKTKSEIAEFSVRDCIRSLKQNRKAVKTLEKIGTKTPGIPEAINAIIAKNETLKKLAVQSVMAQIEQALKDDENED